MAGKINKRSIESLVFNSKKTKQAALNAAETSVNNQKIELINNFLSHPVTQEIQEGENASNISNTLGGYGNLFSFIGFINGSNPIQPIINLLNTIKVTKNVNLRMNKYYVKVFIPSKDDLANVSKMPWENGRSWLWDIERSISGLGAYLYGKFQTSRSKKGLQSRKSFTSKKFIRVSYFTPIYNNFIKKIGAKLK